MNAECYLSDIEYALQINDFERARELAELFRAAMNDDGESCTRNVESLIAEIMELSDAGDE